VKDPELGMDVVTLGMIRDVEVVGGRVSFTFELTTPACPFNEQFQESVRSAVSSLPGVSEVVMKVTSRVPSLRGPSPGPAPSVKNIIAVASGKGGVGKSTISVNLAATLAFYGARVGILDADIYGPNIPHMMGVREPPAVNGEMIIPPISYGVKVMSIAFFTPPDTAVIWRGPLVAGAIRDFLTKVQWGDLDYLIVDLPPGTGDAPLTLAQMAALSGVLIVTTPQDVALRVALKSLHMFRKLDAPIIGLVENMSYFLCPHCGSRHHVFGDGGAARAAEQHGIPLVGQIPLDPSAREASDRGVPLVLAKPRSDAARALIEMSKKVAARVSVLASAEQSRPPSK
jgi:ATP-binding protein involved in chromosome partitioning